MGIGAARADFENFVTCDRATVATAAVSTASTGGVLTEFAAGTVVRYPDPEDATRGVMRVEPQATNRVRNSTCQGAVPGRLDAGGALPDHWQARVGGIPASAVEVIEVGSDDGIDYVRLRYQGTTTSGSVLTLFEIGQQIAVAHGETWAQSAFLRLVAGDVTGITTMRLIQVDGTSSNYHSGGSGAALVPGPDWLRATAVREKDDASGSGVIAYTQPALQFVTASTSEPIDITIDIGLPQIERDAVTSPIRTSGAMATRAKDIVKCAAPVAKSPVSIVVDYRLRAVPDNGYRRVLEMFADIARVSIVVNSVTGAVRISTSDAQGGGAGIDLGPVTPSVWQRVVAVFDGVNSRGGISGGGVVSFPAALDVEGLTTLVFGADRSEANNLVGGAEYGPITVFDRALTETEVAQWLEAAS